MKCFFYQLNFLERRHRIQGKARDEKRVVQIVTPAETDTEASSSSLEPQIEITSKFIVPNTCFVLPQQYSG